MFNKPINNILKVQFETIHSKAVNKSQQDFTDIFDKIEKLEHFDKFKFLVSEKNRI